MRVCSVSVWLAHLFVCVCVCVCAGITLTGNSVSGQLVTLVTLAEVGAQQVVTLVLAGALQLTLIHV